MAFGGKDVFNHHKKDPKLTPSMHLIKLEITINDLNSQGLKTFPVLELPLAYVARQELVKLSF